MRAMLVRFTMSIALILATNGFGREPQSPSRTGVTPPSRAAYAKAPAAGSTSEKKIVRARDLSIPFDGTPGQLNAITDVAGVEVGYTTIVRGAGKLVVGNGPGRTGVTAIIP